MRYLALFLFSLATSFAGLAQAQEPPGRVARLAFTQGSVSVYQDPELGWDKAYVNTPITSENSIWTDRGSRAGLRVGGIAIHLDETTQLDVSLLDYRELDASIERGSANIRVRYKQPDGRITLSTPNARFTIRADGRYRIEVDPERDESRLTVFAGDARMDSRGGGLRVAAGTTVRVFGGPSSSYVTERARSDAFDRWADARD
ncbi:MAG: FecR domain-containing protein, partial [Usitatibacter sp.]